MIASHPLSFVRDLVVSFCFYFQCGSATPYRKRIKRKTGDGAEAQSPVSESNVLLCGSGCALAFCFYAFNRLLHADSYFDLLRLGFFALCQLDFQHAVFIIGVHAVGVDRVRQSERTREAAIAAPDALEVLFLLFL